MFNEFKKGNKVIVYGFGKQNEKFYKNKSAIIIERDPFYLDYHVKFENGSEDWIDGEYLRKPYDRKKKGNFRNEN